MNSSVIIVIVIGILVLAASVGVYLWVASKWPKTILPGNNPTPKGAMVDGAMYPPHIPHDSKLCFNGCTNTFGVCPQPVCCGC